MKKGPDPSPKSSRVFFPTCASLRKLFFLQVPSTWWPGAVDLVAELVPWCPPPSPWWWPGGLVVALVALVALVPAAVDLVPAAVALVPAPGGPGAE